MTKEETHIEITNMLGQIAYKNNLSKHNGFLDEQITLDNSVINGIIRIIS